MDYTEWRQLLRDAGVAIQTLQAKTEDYISAREEFQKQYRAKPMLFDANREEICPYCGKKLRDYRGLRICWCKFCGGKIER